MFWIEFWCGIIVGGSICIWWWLLFINGTGKKENMPTIMLGGNYDSKITPTEAQRRFSCKNQAQKNQAYQHMKDIGMIK